jgi:hypothetical protein
MRFNSTTIYVFIIAYSISGSAFAQSRKQVKANKIKSVTENTIEKINGAETTYKSGYTAFDKDGNTIEKTDYAADGNVKRKQTFKFDSKGNKLEEINFDPILPDKNPKTDANKTDKRNVKFTYKYNVNDDKTEEVEIDGATGKQIKKTQFSYNANGDKSMEVVYDENNVLAKKSVYTYDKKGLKIEKKTYDSVNNLIETKKYVYQY